MSDSGAFYLFIVISFIFFLNCGFLVASPPHFTSELSQMGFSFGIGSRNVLATTTARPVYTC